MEVHVPASNAHVNIFYVNKGIQLDFPVMTRMPAASAAEADRPQYCLIVNLKLFVGCEAIVEQLYIRALVVQVPGESLLTKQHQLGPVGNLHLFEGLIQRQIFECAHRVHELDHMIATQLVWLTLEQHLPQPVELVSDLHSEFVIGPLAMERLNVDLDFRPDQLAL